jgi:hypothetical protein
MHKGININEDIIPIDEEIIQKMEKIGFNKMEIRYNILKNFHNKITTVYDLFLKQKIENGKKSVADLNSDLYDEYINDEKNKIKYYGSFEDALKSRISDGDEKLDRLPNYDEDKYNNENENIIIGDSGSVIERLIKRGKFTYDEENMCINKVSNINTRKENKKEIINDDDGDSKFKTISQMNNKPKKTEKKIEEITKEIMDVKNNFVKKEKTKSPKLSLKKSKIKNLTKSVKIELKICDNESDSEEKEEKVKKKKKVKNDDNDWYNEIEAMILGDSQANLKLKKSSSMDQRKKKDEQKNNASIYVDKAKSNEIDCSAKDTKNLKSTKKIRPDHNNKNDNKNDNKKKTKITNNNNKKEKKKKTEK